MKKRKGFTLIEMIVVLAIIGILMAVLIPTWRYFLMKSNLRSQNSYSKVVFNAAQTQATRYKFVERDSMGIIKNADEKLLTETDSDKIAALESIKTAERNKLFMGQDASGEYYLYWDGEKGHQLALDGSTIDAGANQTLVDEFANSINKVFTHSNDTVYKVYVKDYIVESVCCSRSENSDIIGSYPIEQDGRSDDEILDFNLKKVNLDDSDDNDVPAATP